MEVWYSVVFSGIPLSVWWLWRFGSCGGLYSGVPAVLGVSVPGVLDVPDVPGVLVPGVPDVPDISWEVSCRLGYRFVKYSWTILNLRLRRGLKYWKILLPLFQLKWLGFYFNHSTKQGFDIETRIYGLCN